MLYNRDLVRETRTEIRTFQILGVFREIDIFCPPNEPLIRPDQRIRVNLIALMSPNGERLSKKHDIVSFNDIIRDYVA